MPTGKLLNPGTGAVPRSRCRLLDEIVGLRTICAEQNFAVPGAALVTFYNAIRGTRVSDFGTASPFKKLAKEIL